MIEAVVVGDLAGETGEFQGGRGREAQEIGLLEILAELVVGLVQESQRAPQGSCGFSLELGTQKCSIMHAVKASGLLSSTLRRKFEIET